MPEGALKPEKAADPSGPGANRQDQLRVLGLAFKEGHSARAMTKGRGP
jgi:hypothetical protein